MVASMTDERVARARAPYATANNQTEERPQAFVAALDELGVLDGRTIGVYGSVDVSAETYEATLEALRAAGHEPVEGLTGDNNEDLASTAREAAVVYERFRTAGVDLTFEATGVPLSIRNALDAGYETEQWALVLSMSTTALQAEGLDPAVLDGAYSVNLTPVGTSLQPSMADDPLVAACVDDLEARTGRTISYELGLETNDILAAISACAVVAVLEAGLVNAGPDLTNDSLQAGLEAIGEIELPGLTGASLGPGDLSAASDFLTIRFDAGVGEWVPIDTE